MKRTAPLKTLGLGWAAAFAITPLAWAAPHAHVHGAAKLNVALEGKVLTL
jgi:hypothetical protein